MVWCTFSPDYMQNFNLNPFNSGMFQCVGNALGSYIVLNRGYIPMPSRATISKTTSEEKSRSEIKSFGSGFELKPEIVYEKPQPSVSNLLSFTGCAGIALCSMGTSSFAISVCGHVTFGALVVLSVIPIRVRVRVEGFTFNCSYSITLRSKP